ncbi:unnamed protein product, partial [Prunus brigantina]
MKSQKSGAGVVIITPDGTLLEQAITLGFSASNNEAEYEALLAGLCLAKELSIKRLAIYSDSQLITNQASGEYMAKHPRMNTHADALASLGSALDTQFRLSIPVEHLDRPSIEEIEPIDSMQIDEDPNWQDPIIEYLVNGNLPTDKSEARKVQQKAARYYMRGSKLIRRSYFGPYLTCIKYPQTLEVLCKIHDGECGNHSGGSPWPFMQWAIDLVGPLPPAPAKKEMMVVATDYFTKWIEAEALSSAKEANVERFIWRNIICRFGCPQSLAEASNKVILDCLKKRLEGAEGKWVDELPGVLWAYRTTKRRSTGETPFSLAYGTEAIIPPHVTIPFIGIEVGSIEQNSEQMRLNLDLLEGEREKAIVRVASYQQRLKSWYDKRAKIRHFSFQNVSSTNKTQLLSISSVLWETQGNDQKRPSGDAAHKKRPKGDAGYARNFLREVSSLCLLRNTGRRSLIYSLFSVRLISHALSSSTCLIYDVCHHPIGCILLCSILLSYRLFSHLLFSSFGVHSISLLTFRKGQVWIEHLDVFISNGVEGIISFCAV